MFWKSKEAENTKAGKVSEPAVKATKLHGPTSIPGLVATYLTTEMKEEPNWVNHLMMVMLPNHHGTEAFDIRIFDPEEASAKKVKVKDYTSLDQHPDLILYEGWFDKESKHVELTGKASLTASHNATIFSQDEILQKVESLNGTGNTVFFYLAGSPASGGPFGRGAGVVEVNPNYPGPKEKKYNLYADDVGDTGQPVGKRQKLFDSDKSKEIAAWIKERHHKPYRF